MCNHGLQLPEEVEEMHALVIAHIAGIPVEEWVPSVAASGGCVVLGLRLAVQRLRDHRTGRSRS
jgi:hypothetical protein